MNQKYLIPLTTVFLLFLVAYTGVEGAGLHRFFGIVIPYLAVLAFLAGFVYKVLGWASSAVPFRIPTTCGQQKSLPWIKQNCIDNPDTSTGVCLRMVLEIFLFRSLFRNTKAAFNRNDSNKLSYSWEIFLWIGALAFHYSFLVDIFGIKELTMGLATFSPVIPEGVGGLFYAHLFLVSILFAYFPASKLMHLGGIFLSPTRNMANNTRAKRHVNPWNYDVKTHTYEEYEDHFREKMIEAGLPVDKEE